MQNFFIYLIESSLVLGILFFLYKNLFYKETYFEWNRIYLLAIVFISLIIPLIKLPYELISNVDFAINASIQNSDFSSSNNIFTNVLLQKKETNTNYQFLNAVFAITKIIYGLGVLYFLGNLIKNLAQIFILKKNNEKYKKLNFTFIKTKTHSETFSFFKNIFLSNNFEKLTKNEQNQIIEHEKIHAVQLHSLDILFVELIKIIFWFNPIIWNLKQKVKEIHEYIVDANIATKNLPSEYSRLILKLSINNMKNILASNFSESKIKDRILMLASKESQKLRKRKFLIGLPLLFFVIISFAFTKSMFLGQGSEYAYSYKEFSSAVPINTKVVTPYFTDKIVTKKVKKKGEKYDIKYKVAHKEITYNSFTGMPIKSIASGEIKEIIRTDNWGVQEFEIKIKHNKEFTSVYKNLSESKFKVNSKIKEGDTLAIMGDNRIFQVVNFKLLRNKKAVNPLKYIK